jgi:hypothetical protein
MSQGPTPASRRSVLVSRPPEPEAEPLIIDAEFRPVSPARRLWRAFRIHWWALGPYLAYCAALWGLAALVGWLIEKGRL